MKREDALSRRRPLSDTVLASLEPESKPYQISNQDNIHFRVKANGRKDWQLRYKKPDGKWAWAGLGGYPQTKWAAARKKADEYKEQIQRGEAPKTSRRQKVDREAKEEFTFKARAEAWRENKQASVSAKTLSKDMRRLEMYVLPAVADRDVRGIRPVEWVELLKGIEHDNGGMRDTIDRTRRIVKEVYTFAKFAGFVDSNPLEDAQRFLPKAEDSSYKWVPIEAMPQLLREIRSYSGMEYIKLGLFLISRPGLRTGPFRFAEWSEINLDNAVWDIPGEHMKGKQGKAGKPLDVPLPSQAVAAFRRLYELTGHTKLVFPGRNDSTKPVSDATFLRALYSMGYKGRQTSHGFRHQFSTIAHENWPDKTLVIESQMAHEDGSTRGVYNAAEYFEERKELLQWYADYLDEREGFTDD